MTKLSVRSCTGCGKKFVVYHSDIYQHREKCWDCVEKESPAIKMKNEDK